MLDFCPKLLACENIPMTRPFSFWIFPQANLPQLLAALEAVAADHQPALDRAIAALDHGKLKMP